MPTTAEFQALGNATTSAWTNDYQGSGVAGLILTEKNDSSKVLFFPAAGDCFNGSVYNVGSNGYYWSSSLGTNNMTNGRYLNFYSSICYVSNDIRNDGCSVRGVAD